MKTGALPQGFLRYKQTPEKFGRHDLPGQVRQKVISTDHQLIKKEVVVFQVLVLECIKSGQWIILFQIGLLSHKRILVTRKQKKDQQASLLEHSMCTLLLSMHGW